MSARRGQPAGDRATHSTSTRRPPSVPNVRVMPSPSLLRATGVALLVAAPLALSGACALPQSGIPASQSVPVGGGTAHSTIDDAARSAATDVSTSLTSIGTVLT